MFKVVGRQALEACHQRRAVLVGQLLGVQLDGQAVGMRGLEHALGLRVGKADPLAEGVDRVHQAFGRQLRQHGAANVVDVVVGASGKFRRQRMRAQEGGRHVNRQHVRHLARNAQHFPFRRQVQAIAGLDFNGGHALGQKARDTGQALAQQFGVAGSAGGAHGGHDAAASAGNVFVGGAIEACFEFVAAVARVDNVGMAVDQAGREPAAAAVMHLGCRRRLGTCTDPGNAPASDGDGRVMDLAIAVTRGHGGNADIGVEGVAAHHHAWLKKMSTTNTVARPASNVQTVPLSNTTAS